MPLRQSRRDVSAEDQEQLAIWHLIVQLFKGIDRERRPRSRHLEVRDGEPLVAVDCQPAKRESMLGARLVLDRLVRRYAGRNEHHSTETQLKVRLLRAHEVTKVWRI